MIQHYKKLSQLKGKKRYILFGFLAVELMSLPAAAQIVHKAAFDVRPNVTAVEIPTSETGVSRFLVTSNGGFDVKANDVVGNITAAVHLSGSLGRGNRFGGATQLPGPQSICAQATGSNAVIYKADRKIAAREGTTPERAVVIEFNYEPTARPVFNFVAGQKKTAALISCST